MKAILALEQCLLTVSSLNLSKPKNATRNIVWKTKRTKPEGTTCFSVLVSKRRMCSVTGKRLSGTDCFLSAVHELLDKKCLCWVW
jgi:hypothetical protein